MKEKRGAIYQLPPLRPRNLLFPIWRWENWSTSCQVTWLTSIDAGIQTGARARGCFLPQCRSIPSISTPALISYRSSERRRSLPEIKWEEKETQRDPKPSPSKDNQSNFSQSRCSDLSYRSMPSQTFRTFLNIPDHHREYSLPDLQHSDTHMCCTEFLCSSWQSGVLLSLIQALRHSYTRAPVHPSIRAMLLQMLIYRHYAQGALSAEHRASLLPWASPIPSFMSLVLLLAVCSRSLCPFPPPPPTIMGTPVSSSPYTILDLETWL